MPKGRGLKGNALPRNRKKKMDAKSRKNIAEVICEDSAYMHASKIYIVIPTKNSCYIDDFLLANKNLLP